MLVQASSHLSVYVDDFKMAGRKANLAPMWKLLGEHIDLDPPTKMDGGVYLGCGQFDIKAPAPLIKEKQETFQHLLQPGSYDSTTKCDKVEHAETHCNVASSGQKPAETQGTVPCIGGFAAPRINQLFPPRTSTTSEKRGGEIGY